MLSAGLSFVSRQALLAALLVAASPLTAAPADTAANDTDAADGKGDTVVITGQRDSYAIKRTRAAKIDADRHDIPQTIDVVPEAVLRDQRALSVQDALKNVPGIGFSHGDGQRDQVTIRGFTAIADQFIDGVRDDALYFRDLSNVERIEVLKGPASVLYGRGSSGGLINRVTKKPGSNIAALAVSYGRAQDARGEFDVGIGDDRAALRLTGAIERADSYRQQQFLSRETVAPAVRFANAATQIMLQADYLRDKRVTDFGIPSFAGLPVKVPRGTYYGSANARRDDFSLVSIWSTTLTVDHALSDRTHIHDTLRYYDYDLDRQNTVIGAVNQQTRKVTLSRSSIDRRDRGWFNQLELTHEGTIAGTGHKLLAGIEIGHQTKTTLSHGIDPAQAPIVDLFKPVLPTTLPPLRLTLHDRGGFDTFGVYVQDLASFGDHWKALVGGRIDRFGQSSRNLVNRDRLKRNDVAFSPRVGLVWQPDRTQSYYASWSRSFQPSAEAFNLTQANADIAPERTTNIEVGAKYALWDDRAALTLSAFQLERTGIKASNPATPLKIEPIGVQRTRGIEASATGTLRDGWSLIAGYAYLDAKIVASPSPLLLGKRAAITPEHGANLWLAKAFGDRFGFGGGVNYVGDSFADPANSVRLPDHLTADAMAWMQIGALRAQVNVTNLFDRDYIGAAHGSSPNLLLPAPPRQALLTLRYIFAR